MSSFDLEKMVGTIDNLSTCLDIMLCSKDTDGGHEILESCDHLDNLITSFGEQINVLENALIKERNSVKLSGQRQLEELKMIEKRCEYMIENIPINACHTNEHNSQYEIKEYRGNNLNNMTNISMSPVSTWNNTYSPLEKSVNHTTLSNSTSMSTTMMGQLSKSQACKQTPDIPLLKLIDNNEMDTVPKYMKGRLTSSNVNVVINSMNIALENKYSILQKSKSTLKKKDLDMYNTWKIQQNSVGQGRYFVTAADITKFSETKVDKTTLNIIPILRHLKRVKESRTPHFVS